MPGSGFEPGSPALHDETVGSMPVHRAGDPGSNPGPGESFSL